MKRFFTMMLTLVLLCNLFAICAMAEEGQSGDSTPSQSSEAPKPSESTGATDPSKPSDSQPTAPSDPSQSTTAPTEPKPCTHVYGDWTADEVAHGRTCTLCGYSESNSHSWASETVTVAPTCGEPGGVCKVCTVCGGVLVTSLIEPTGNHTYTNACDTSCDVCGGERTITHTFGTDWKYSGKGHWHYCRICGAADEVKSHYPGPAATEDKEQICLTCGMVMMKKKAHAHKWDTSWTSDESGHWYQCTGNSTCEEKNSYSAHTYDNGCDAECNDCGYVRATQHTYGLDFIQTELTHSGVCTVCGEAMPAENHIANAAGTECGICGYAMEIPEETHAHSFEADTWGFDENGHWNICMCGEKDNATPHVWDKGEEKGKQILYSCEVCAATKTDEAPEKGITWLFVGAGVLILFCLIGIVVCFMLIRKNREDYR